MRAHVTHVSEQREQRLAEKEKGTSRGSFSLTCGYVDTAFSSAKTIHSPRQPVRLCDFSAPSRHTQAHPLATTHPSRRNLDFQIHPKGSRLLCLSALVRSFLLPSPRNTTARVTCRLNGLASVAECCNPAITFCVYWLLDGILPDIARGRDFTIHGDDRANRKCVHLAGDVRGLQYRCFMDVSGLIQLTPAPDRIYAELISLLGNKFPPRSITA